MAEKVADELQRRLAGPEAALLDHATDPVIRVVGGVNGFDGAGKALHQQPEPLVRSLTFAEAHECKAGLHRPMPSGLNPLQTDLIPPGVSQSTVWKIFTFTQPVNLRLSAYGYKCSKNLWRFSGFHT